MGSPYVSFDGSNDGKLVGSYLDEFLKYIDVTLLDLS